MKKITITFALLIIVALGLSAQYSIGLYAGGSYCNVKEKVINDVPFIDLEGPGSSYGFTIGLKAEKHINRNFSLVGNLSYFNKNVIWAVSKERVNYQYFEPLLGFKIKPTLIADNKFTNNFAIIPSFGYSVKFDKKEEQFDNYNSFITLLELEYSIKKFDIKPFIEWSFNSFYTFKLPTVEERSDFYFRNYGIKIGYTLSMAKRSNDLKANR